MTDLEVSSSWFWILIEGDTEVKCLERLAEAACCHLSGCSDKGLGMEQAPNPNLEGVVCNLRGMDSEQEGGEARQP